MADIFLMLHEAVASHCVGPSSHGLEGNSNNLDGGLTIDGEIVPAVRMTHDRLYDIMETLGVQWIRTNRTCQCFNYTQIVTSGMHSGVCGLSYHCV